jgi:hypothetical protein
MSATLLQEECLCHDCGKPLDARPQADGKGGYYLIVTCWNPHCLLRTFTRSLTSYTKLTDTDWEAYREMNRVPAQAVQSSITQ